MEQRWESSIKTDVSYVGPNHGQVSTYALFTILFNNLLVLNDTNDANLFESKARQLVTVQLQYLPKMIRTPDLLSQSVNLTSGSFLAKRMALALEQIPHLETDPP